jgi:hypothetical protein
MNEPILSNIAGGTHAGHLTRTLEAPVSTRYLVATTGTAAGAATVCTASDAPLGVFTDEGDSGEAINVALLGAARSTLLAVAGAGVNAGDYLVCGAGGRVLALPASPGTYEVIGQAVSAAATDGLVEFDPRPHTRTV